uniref:Poly(A) RNA polymerase protein 2 n=1 Tax=Saccharomyces cerevisiae TaxID=4932 RepID=UPI0001DD3797|nr:Chain A, Poly(A) RNA polymerase protein 2 [Saccharomyces cerevisiae]
GSYPWILNHDHSKQKEISDWLTFEIKDFVAYISPSREEIEIRNQTISTIREAVKQLWPDADLHVFGSYSTDLYLPGSDIDCVVTSELGGKESRNNLYSLASHLKKKNLATEVEVVAKARVPIIKFVEPHSGIHIAVSFERTNGIEAAKLIREWLDDTPGLRELVLIVKQFLHARRLNNVHTGGLGGFSIICLVFSFLHMHPRIITNEIDPKDNLGVLLIEFFELYGKNFGYDDVALGSSDGYPVYFPKSTWSAIQPIKNPFSLAIQDPGDESNNISRGSFNIRDIKKAFAGAFDLLTNRCFELHSATFKDRLGKSILGNVIKY